MLFSAPVAARHRGTYFGFWVQVVLVKGKLTVIS